MTAAQRRKNVAAIATRAISLLASLAGRRSAAGDQDAQGKIVGWLLGLVKHDEEGIKRSALDGILRVADKDREAMAAVLPAVLLGLMRLLGDDDSRSTGSCSRSSRSAWRASPSRTPKTTRRRRTRRRCAPRARRRSRRCCARTTSSGTTTSRRCTR